MNYINKNKNEHEELYKEGWGISYPDSSTIRIYEHFYKTIMGLNSANKNLLDFGCGNGTNSKYFKDKGFNVFGIDISNNAIEYCKDTINKNTFKDIDCLNKDVIIEDIFNTKFDVIFASHVLYLFNNEDLEKILQKFNNALNDNGIVIFSMMTNKCFFNKFIVESESINELKKVKLDLKNRPNQEYFINFSQDEEDVKSKFDIFELLFIGKYDFNLFEGSTEHIYFIGQKKKVNI